MATAPPKLAEEHIDAIIDGVRTGWLDEITITDETEADPFVRVILKGQKLNYHKRAYEEIIITLGEFKLKPERSYHTFKRVSRQYMSLYREAQQVRRVAIQAELSPPPSKEGGLMETTLIPPVEETVTLPCCADPFCEGCGPAPLSPELPPLSMSESELDELYIEWMELVEEGRWEQEEALVRRLFR